MPGWSRIFEAVSVFLSRYFWCFPAFVAGLLPLFFSFSLPFLLISPFFSLLVGLVYFRISFSNYCLVFFTFTSLSCLDLCCLSFSISFYCPCFSLSSDPSPPSQSHTFSETHTARAPPALVTRGPVSRHTRRHSEDLIRLYGKGGGGIVFVNLVDKKKDQVCVQLCVCSSYQPRFGALEGNKSKR